MFKFFSNEELAAFSNEPNDSIAKKLYKDMKERVKNYSEYSGLKQPQDDCSWYHICWERLSDASFVYAVEKDTQLGDWIHNSVMSVIKLPKNEWVGPWIRTNFKPIDWDTATASLETAHLTLAVCEAIVNAENVFSKEEKEEISSVLKDVALLLCKRFCVQQIEHHEKHVAENLEGYVWFSNWFACMLNGYATVAAVLDSKEDLEIAYSYLPYVEKLYNKDSYGESLQYSIYTSLHYLHSCEIFKRCGFDTQGAASGYAVCRLMPWYASSYFGKKQNPDGTATSYFANFGDSGYEMRPAGDVLCFVANRFKNSSPREASLAAWLLNEIYADAKNDTNILSTFGFKPNFGYYTLLYLGNIAKPKNPVQVTMPRNISFETGNIIVRDSWQSPKAILAIMAGYKTLNVTSHNHKDYNSFQMIINGERMLADPGHCCYRLESHLKSVDERSHSNISLYRDSKRIDQDIVGGNFFVSQKPLNKLLRNEIIGDIQVIASDMTDVYKYDGHIKQAVRYWFVKMPNAMFVVDCVESDLPFAMESKYLLDNTDNRLDARVFSTERIVFRKGNAALKLFNVFTATDGEKSEDEFLFDWSFTHKYYHPEPNRDGQGKEGSGLIYRWKNKKQGLSQLRITSFAFDEESNILGWHVDDTEDGFINISSPQNASYLKIKYNNRKIMIGEGSEKIHEIEI